MIGEMIMEILALYMVIALVLAVAIGKWIKVRNGE